MSTVAVAAPPGTLTNTLATISTSTVVLGKRKSRPASTSLSIRLEVSSGCEQPTDSECETDISYSHATTSAGPSTLTKRLRRYKCQHAGCSKAYTKPSRLAEHERSHTGDRPFTCNTCNKSYLRETHLQAHARSHLPASARPFVCSEPDCDKRFWTTQHLHVHSELHKGEKPFKCTESGCEASFIKHHQLRDHICSAHAPPGTKPYRCEHPGCQKSFLTNQKLRGHMKTHDDKRYTCVHVACLPGHDNAPAYYPTWTALQHHIRTAHPPICAHPTCNGKTFKSQKGLRAHMKLHDQSAVEGLIGSDSDADSDADEPPYKKRRGGEAGRDWVCEFEGCDKDFKSKKALTNHRNVNHLGRRDFVCPHDTCRRAFGYKHLLQRHLGKLHKPDGPSASQAQEQTEDADMSSDDVESGAEQVREINIDDITGKSYAMRAQQQLSSPRTLRCPHPDLHGLVPPADAIRHGEKQCEYVFTRAYDLRRHLRSEHGQDVEKDVVDTWVRLAREAKNASAD